MKFSLAIPVAPDRDCEILNSINKLDYSKKDYEVLIEKGLNPSDNRNRCIKKAKFDLIYFLDDDAVLPSNFLERAKEFFDRYPDVDLVGGPQLTPGDDKGFAKVSGYAVESFFGCFKMSQRYKKGKLNLDADEMSLTSANCCVKKKVFDKVDDFNPKFFPGEDPEIFDRIKSAGFKMAFNPELVIYHRRRADIKGFLKQFYRYGKVRLKKEKSVGGKPNFVFFIPSLFTLYLFGLPLSYFSSFYLIPLGIYFLIAILFSIFIGVKKRSLSGFLFVPFVFFLMHISYGLGLISYFFDRKSL